MTYGSTSMHSLGKTVWVTRDGTKMTWAQMTVRHLRNCAAYIENNTVARLNDSLDKAFDVLSAVTGYAAQNAVDSQITHMEKQRAQAKHYAETMRAYAAWREKQTTPQGKKTPPVYLYKSLPL